MHILATLFQFSIGHINEDFNKFLLLHIWSIITIKQCWGATWTDLGSTVRREFRPKLYSHCSTWQRPQWI